MCIGKSSGESSVQVMTNISFLVAWFVIRHRSVSLMNCIKRVSWIMDASSFNTGA